MSVSQSIHTDRAVQESETCAVHNDVPLPRFSDDVRLLCVLCAREARAASYATSRAFRATDPEATRAGGLPPCQSGAGDTREGVPASQSSRVAESHHT
jgi:hypothetical protein